MKLTQLGVKGTHYDAMLKLERDDLNIARVINESKNAYTLSSEIGETYAKVSGVMRHKTKQRVDLPIVGDWVAAQLINSDGVAIIHEILPRTNTISRKVAGENTEEQPIASKVDTLFFMIGLDNNFNCNRIERYLNLAWSSGTQPVIILNKKDLLNDVELEDIEDQVNSVAFGTPYHFISSINKESLEILTPYFSNNKSVILVGSSGVGKSTLTNLLLGRNEQKTTETREFDSKGRHTTTSRRLFVLPCGGILIDSPGMREVQLWFDGNQKIGNFEDIEALAERCHFSDCSHQKEPGCAVLEAIDNGALMELRLTSYHKLCREMDYLAKRKKEKSWDSGLEDRKFGKERHNYLKHRNRN